MNIYKTFKQEDKTLLDTISENKIFRELIEDNKEGVFNNNGTRQNIDMFLKKLRGILFDFKRELFWSFDCMYLLITKILKCETKT